MLRYLMEKRRKTETAVIPVDTLKEALIAYLTPFDPGYKDISDITFTGVPELINTTIYYERSSLRPKKTKRIG